MSNYDRPMILAEGLSNRLKRTAGLDNRLKVLSWIHEERNFDTRPKNKIVGLVMRFLAWVR